MEEILSNNINSSALNNSSPIVPKAETPEQSLLSVCPPQPSVDISVQEGETVHKEKIVIRKIEKPKGRLGYRIIKRAFDFIVSLLASIVLILPMLIIALAVKFDSKGPVFYRQQRLGIDGKPFWLWKYRSMKVDAEANGAQWAKTNDDRCTKVGAVLRLFRLDELPQIPFNILPGTLSIVGPRPEREVFYKQFATYIDGFEQRLYVKPGLTGLAQVSGGYDLLPEEKIVYDLEYIESSSLLTDLKVIFKTVAVIFKHDGAR